MKVSELFENSVLAEGRLANLFAAAALASSACSTKAGPACDRYNNDIERLDTALVGAMSAGISKETIQKLETARQEMIDDCQGERKARADRLATMQSPKIGMTDRAVIDKTWLGSPDKINTTRSKNNVFEQWVYDEEKMYLYFKNGKLTTIQTF